jgi:restriction system protein
LNTARASLEELLLDYEDYLRHRHLEKWTPDCPEARAVRQVGKEMKNDRSDQQRWALYARWLENVSPAVRANALICLINQANYLLDRQIAALEKAFVEEGGYSEQLAAARLAERQQKKEQSAPTDLIPSCPKCGKAMVLRTAKTGKAAGRNFWGCSLYPDCKGAAKI